MKKLPISRRWLKNRSNLLWNVMERFKSMISKVPVPPLHHLRVFGRLCFAHSQSQKEHKFPSGIVSFLAIYTKERITCLWYWNRENFHLTRHCLLWNRFSIHKSYHQDSCLDYTFFSKPNISTIFQMTILRNNLLRL